MKEKTILIKYLIILILLTNNTIYADQRISDTEQLFGKYSSHRLLNLEDRQGNYTASEGYFQIIFSKEKNIQDKIMKDNKEAHQAYFNGDYSRAILLCEKVKLYLRENLKKEEWLTVANMNNLALLYQNQESYHEAQIHYKKALQASKKIYGDDHPKTAVVYGNMAILYQQLGNGNKAFNLHQKALEIREKILGKLHKDTALSYHNLGAFYQNVDLHMNPKAYDYYHKALIIRKKVLG